MSDGESRQIHQQSLRMWHNESEGNFCEEGRDGGSHREKRSLHLNSKKEEDTPVLPLPVRCGKCAHPHNRIDWRATAPTVEDITWRLMQDALGL